MASFKSKGDSVFISLRKTFEERSSDKIVGTRIGLISKEKLSLALRLDIKDPEMLKQAHADHTVGPDIEVFNFYPVNDAK